MLKLIPQSSNLKTGPIATTYRSAPNNPYGTCPSTCPLLPILQPNQTASQEIDNDYLIALQKTVPKNGYSWTYSHFSYSLLPRPTTGTIINVSTDSVAKALTTISHGYPTVLAAPHTWHRATPKYPTEAPIKFAECPANLNPRIKCSNCGNGRPLCARPDRDYVVVFPRHGSSKTVVGTSNPTGGCYGIHGNTRIHWDKLSKKQQDPPDYELLTHWVKTLPYRSLLRHHIVGGLGRIQP